MSDVILQASGVHKSYQLGRFQLKVLKGLSISVRRGEFLAIMGSSGSGKSTFLHLLGALDVPDKGTIKFNGQDVFAGSPAQRDRLRNQSFGFVFQFYHLLPELNVLENVMLPCMVGQSVWSWFGRRKAVKKHAREMIRRVGLEDRIRHRPNELSGGERQRVAIARALANQPVVLLADEPTGNLDTATGNEILSALQALNRQGQTIVMVTHDSKVAKVADRTITLVDGKVVDGKEAVAATNG
jgi:ABC-type lipoprotein export system ATPase subunit